MLERLFVVIRHSKNITCVVYTPEKLLRQYKNTLYGIFVAIDLDSVYNSDVTAVTSLVYVQVELQIF